MSELKMPENTFGYVHNGSTVIWNVEDIWRAADSLKITTLDIDYFHGMMANVQLEYDEDDWRRVEKADLKYPIIVGRCKKKGWLSFNRWFSPARETSSFETYEDTCKGYTEDACSFFRERKTI